MGNYDNWKLVHEFLRTKFDSLDVFTRDELEDASRWPKDKATFSTYWTKQILPLLVPHLNNKYRVSEVFRRFIQWEDFLKHVTQNRNVTANYGGITYSWVMMFEFFMPLTNESYLRTTLDSLFYKDRVLRRLKINLDALKKHFPFEAKHKNDDDYLSSIADWVGDHFGGYSIGHVSGRYRAAKLKTLSEAQKMQLTNERYLVDESTAIVRFIIPFGGKAKTAFEGNANAGPAQDQKSGESEAATIRFIFGILFIEQIVEAVAGEDEIWLLESGFGSKLHVWSKSS